MAPNYTEYLAANVLNDQQFVSYRMLSRALKVHNNLAKQMLYEFHRKQNARNPRSVHATYLVTGTPRSSQTNGVHTHDGDDSLPSSSFPLPSSSMPGTQEQEEAPDVVPRRSMLLVREEHLDRARDKFESIRGIHIYSVQAKGISDMQALTDCNRQIATKYASEDPLQAWKQYGTIQNAYVRRRTGGRAAPPPAAVVKPTAPAAAAPAKTTPATAPPKPAAESTAINTEHVTAAPRNKSDIFKSFAKTQPPKPKDVAKVVAPEEDVPMGGFSDDDDDEEEESQNDPWADESKAPPTGKSRNEREAELKAMMEREDESMDDGNPADDEAKDDEDSQGAIDKPAAAPDIPETTATVVNGRRRGRRRVMKKKTVRDEEGFLVTREEAAWESFSEDDEPVAKKAKLPAVTAPKSSSQQKGGKPGQGNIMSFFGKK